MADADRIKRLRASVLAVPADDLRNATRRIGEESIRALPGPARPLANQLKRSGDPASLLKRLPNTTVLAMVADVISDDCLHATRDALGDAADDPSMNQLQGAIEVVLETHDPAVVRVMLATVAVADAEASDKCDELLTTDDRFTLPDIDDSAESPKPPKSGPSEEVLAKRKERKEAEKAKKAAQREKGTRPQRKKSDDSSSATTADEPPPPVVAATRRAPTGVPDGFDVDDPLAGAIVLADIPFDAGVGGKTRPAVVIAVADDDLLVRPGYSEGGVHSRGWYAHELRDLAAAGVRKRTWIERDARTISRADASAPIGRVSDDDWNALF